MKPIEQWMMDNYIKANEPFAFTVFGDKTLFIIKSDPSTNMFGLILYNRDGLTNIEILNYEREGYLLIANGIKSEPELKPCPICGKTENVYTEDYEDQDLTYFSIHCRSCHVETSECCSKHKAINIWNGWKRSPEQ